jgi:hypothetical protein
MSKSIPAIYIIVIVIEGVLNTIVMVSVVQIVITIKIFNSDRDIDPASLSRSNFNGRRLNIKGTFKSTS